MNLIGANFAGRSAGAGRFSVEQYVATCGKTVNVMNLSSTVSQSFRDRADPAAFWEAWVGAVLARAGLYTLHNPFLIDGNDHSHTFDLAVFEDLDHYNGITENCSCKSVEIKSQNKTFTKPEDYPYEPLLVCSQNSFMKKWPHRDCTGRDFLFVSTVTGNIVWLPFGSKVRLGHEVYDRGRGELSKYAVTDKSNLRPLQDFVDYVRV